MQADRAATTANKRKIGLRQNDSPAMLPDGRRVIKVNLRAMD
jgi:hypothetical protein